MTTGRLIHSHDFWELRAFELENAIIRQAPGVTLKDAEFEARRFIHELRNEIARESQRYHRSQSLRCRLGFHRLDHLASHYMGIDVCQDCQAEAPDLSGPVWWRWLYVRWSLFKTERFWPWVRYQRDYWRPCPECGMYHHDHDENVDHLPF